MTLPPKKPGQLAPIDSSISQSVLKSKKQLTLTESGSVAAKELMQAIGKE
jgi:hypothetical protein